jgi:AsmA protein
VRLKELFPTLDKLKESGGALGAQVRLRGRGNSVASMLASANGSIAAGMAGGKVSELAVWLVNLNGGELIPLLFGGDRPTPVRCAAAALDVKGGIATIGTFVFDTDESRIDGSGSIDFRNERVDILLRPEAKKPGLLSIRGPVHIQGPFRDVHFAVAPQSIARGLGAIALGIVNPLLALLPLVETGPGEDANCRAVLEPVKGAVRQSGKSEKDAPAKGEKPAKGADESSAAARSGSTVGLEREKPAPIVEVDPKK